MDIKLHEIFVNDLADGYVDNTMTEGGIFGYGGKLNIRPPFQRNFVYNEKQRDAVIDTLMQGFPLNVMYWVKNGEDDYEVLDGQQRTISICQYVHNKFSVLYDGRLQFFNGLPKDIQEWILNYKLFVYFCKGEDSEKLKWFRTINIAGEKLTEQELRNAVYVGNWVADAKRWFSKTGGPAYQIGNKYLDGSANRQDYLETAIAWMSGGNIEKYMSEHQHDADATPLWEYFQNVIEWTYTTFPKYRKEMKGLPWGTFYNEYKDNTYDAAKLENRVKALILDRDITAKKGIYEYVLSGENKEKERCLNVRSFDDQDKREAYERQNGVCPNCKKRFELEEMEADHITPWHEGGKTVAENCQMLCKECNRRKSGK